MGTNASNFTLHVHRMEGQSADASDYALNVHHENDEVDDVHTFSESERVAIGLQSFGSTRTAAFDSAMQTAWGGSTSLTGAEKDELYDLFHRERKAAAGVTP